MLKVNDKVMIIDKTISGSLESLPGCNWKIGDIAYIGSIREYNGPSVFLKKSTLPSIPNEYGRFSINDVKKFNTHQERLSLKYGHKI